MLMDDKAPIPVPRWAGSDDYRRPPQTGRDDRQGAGATSFARGAPPSSIDPSVGDWQCGQCSNWNWARRSECNKCGGPHPTRHGGRPAPPSAATIGRDRAIGLDTGGKFAGGGSGADARRTGEGGGFREFDESEDVRRKRIRDEERQETEQRKATKTKCAFCKRASCIC